MTRGRRVGVAALLVVGTLFWTALGAAFAWLGWTRVRSLAEFGADAAPLRPTAHPEATGV